MSATSVPENSWARGARIRDRFDHFVPQSYDRTRRTKVEARRLTPRSGHRRACNGVTRSQLLKHTPQQPSQVSRTVALQDATAAIIERDRPSSSQCVVQG